MKTSYAAFTLATIPCCLGIAKQDLPSIQYCPGSEVIIRPCQPNGCSCCDSPCSCDTPCDFNCAYTYPTYNLECAWGLELSGELLYWFGKETGLIYAIENQTIRNPQIDDTLPSFTIAPRKIHRIKESWNTGFRVGIGSISACDRWRIGASWTYFHTDRKASQSVTFSPSSTSLFLPSTNSLKSPWTTTDAVGFVGSSEEPSDTSFFDSIFAKWNLYFNQFDLEIDRQYWISPCMSLRPFLGIRGGWTKSSFFTLPSVSFFEDTPSSILLSQRVTFHNQFWGWGLVGGLQPIWHLSNGFCFYGSMDAALLWGCFQLDRKGKLIIVDAGQNLTSNFGKAKDRFSQMQAILDLEAGICWENTFCCNRYLFGIDLGWEHHLWFNHNHRLQLIGRFDNREEDDNFTFRSYVNVEDTYGDLILAGLHLRLRLGF